MRLFGSKRVDDLSKRFVSEPTFSENLSNQTLMSLQVVAQLRTHGVTNDAKLKLEFFYYTDDEVKAQSLVNALRAIKYKVETKQSEEDSHLQIVTGWTTPIKMSDSDVVAWTKTMCLFGYECDCEFDGWGTYPKQ